MQDKLKFMDFCAGIGGGRLGLLENNFECVGYSEIDEAPDYTYKLFYGDIEINYGDLMVINPAKLPEFDIMIGGFPCQSYSIVGQRKGLEDLRGQIIYGLIEILKAKSVPYFILENVKGLVNHDKGQTIKIILEEMYAAGYKVEWKVLDSVNYGVPQMRERVYFVGVKKDLATDKKKFIWPNEVKIPNLSDYLIDTENGILDHENDTTFKKYINNKYNIGKFNLEEIISEDYLVLDTRQSDLRLYRGKVPTLRTGRHGILYVKDRILKKLSGYEALLLQGFSKEVAEKSRGKLTEGKLLSQAGNAMTVSTIAAIGKQLMNYIKGADYIMDDLVLRGSNTARNGFKNEKDIADKFNEWETDTEAKFWLEIMSYNLEEIEYVRAVVIHGYKTDVNVQIKIKLKRAIDIENIQVKLVSNKKGFNQVDKRYLRNYNELWNIPVDVYELLQHFTGELPPKVMDTRDNRRMFLDEFTREERNIILKFFEDNKVLIITDILRGRGEFSAEWVLVAQKVAQNSRWVLKNINEVLQHYSEGPVEMSPRGSINIGRIGVQRKGGDGGRDTAKMLQFKVDPTELFDI
ncbi:MAG: DNA (cytosine-5-)-methyltransferase [Lutisporaceae bacterium]